MHETLYRLKNTVFENEWVYYILIYFIALFISFLIYFTMHNHYSQWVRMPLSFVLGGIWGYGMGAERSKYLRSKK